VLDVSLKNISLTQIFVMVLLSTIASVGFGLFLGVWGLVTDQMHFVLNIINYVLLIFTGAEFPISQLPPICQFLSQCLPLTRSIAAARLLFARGMTNEIIQLMLGELLLAVVYFLLGAGLLRIVEKFAVKKAALEVF